MPKNQRQYGDAIACYEQSLQISRKLGNLAHEAESLRRLGFVYYDQGHWNSALSCLQQSLAIISDLADQSRQAEILNGLGAIYANQEDWIAAISTFTQAVEIAHFLSDDDVATEALNNLGVAYQQLGVDHHQKGQVQEAIDSYEQSLEIAHQANNRGTIVETLNNLGLLHASQGSEVQAAQAFQQAIQVARDIGEPNRIGHVLGNAGGFYTHIKQFSQAKFLLQEALTYLSPDSPAFQPILLALGQIEQDSRTETDATENAATSHPTQHFSTSDWSSYLGWGIAIFLIVCVVKGQWLLAILSIAAGIVVEWHKRIKRRDRER